MRSASASTFDGVGLFPDASRSSRDTATARAAELPSPMETGSVDDREIRSGGRPVAEATASKAASSIRRCGAVRSGSPPSSQRAAGVPRAVTPSESGTASAGWP